MEITRAVIPAAGLGTRFLPFTKAIPKEMLPLIDKPALQIILEECASSSIQTIALISTPRKTSLTTHTTPISDTDHEILSRSKNWSSLVELNALLAKITITTIFQPEPLGLGHAIWLARQAMDQEYFGICLPDDIIVGPEPALAQLIALAQQENASIIAVQEVPREELGSYGVVSIKKTLTKNLFEVSHLIEKPSPQDAPSNLAIVGRYVLSPLIFTALENMSAYAHEELQLTSAISRMIELGERVIAYKVPGTRYDIGTPLGWIKALLGTAWNSPLYGDAVRQEINRLHEASTTQHLPCSTDLP